MCRKNVNHQPGQFVHPDAIKQLDALAHKVQAVSPFSGDVFGEARNRTALLRAMANNRQPYIVR